MAGENGNQKSDQEIVDDCNILAALFYRMIGNDAGLGYKFYEATHPQEVAMWNMAVAAYDHIEGTDVENALDMID